MKTSLFVIGSVVIGAAIGLAAAFARHSLPGDADPLGGNAATVVVDPPKVVVDQESFDLGEAIEGARVVHRFIFANHGTGVLELHHDPETDSTCKCTIGAIDKGRVLPGEQTEVKLTIIVEDVPGPFRQHAIIHTNDPQRPRVTLTVTGEVSRPVSSSVDEVVIGRVAAKESGSSTFRVYAFHDNDLEILSHEFDADTAELFEAGFKRLSAAELEEEPTAKSGWEVTISLKPGLPLGPFRQTIRLRVKTGDVEAPLELPIRGSIVSDFYVSGPGWDTTREILRLGLVHGREGKKWKVYLLVRGPHRNEVRAMLRSTVPDALRVSVGEPQSLPGGRLVRMPLELEIPPGTPSLTFQGENLGGYGKIVLETTHPEIKEYQILVSLVVEG